MSRLVAKKRTIQQLLRVIRHSKRARNPHLYHATMKRVASIGAAALLLLASLGWLLTGPTLLAQGAPAVPYPLVFVSRQIPDQGSIYWSAPRDQPGLGAHSRFRVASPGQLMVREIDGTLRLLIDGATPTTA